MTPYPTYDTFLIERASGEWETLKVPRVFSARELAAKLQHSLVFLKLRRGWYIIAKDQIIRGPRFVLIDPSGDDHKIVDDPKQYAATGGAV